MLPDRVSNPGPLTYESGVLPIALRGPAKTVRKVKKTYIPIKLSHFITSVKSHFLKVLIKTIDSKRNMAIFTG